MPKSSFSSYYDDWKVTKDEEHIHGFGGRVDGVQETSMFAIIRRSLSPILIALLLLPTLQANAQADSCSSYDAWIWAQTVYETDPGAFAGLDPDGNGIACENLAIGGFAPVLWTDEIPASAVPATVSTIIDGDTFDVIIDGQTDRIRMYHIDTPETSNLGGGLQCGGNEASQYLAFVLGFAPGGTVYLEYDQTQRDRFDRRLAYVWYQIGDDVYLVNEVMVRNGWAESDTYKPDDKYKEQLDAAEQFSIQKVLGVRLLCGKFGQPVGSAPSGQQLREAQQRQPNQGQFANIMSREQIEAQKSAPPPTAVPVVQQPAPAPAQATGDCDPAYPTVCIAPVWKVGDLNCKDVPYRRFQVNQPDPHNFDGDFDGVGCESG